jgi:ankyrin repeat protein
MEDSEIEVKNDLIDRFENLKYKAKAINCDNNKFSISPHHLMVLNNELELASKLNTWGGNPLQTLKNGNTLLHAAVLQNCSVEILEYILDRKVDINA